MRPTKIDFRFLIILHLKKPMIKKVRFLTELNYKFTVYF